MCHKNRFCYKLGTKGKFGCLRHLFVVLKPHQDNDRSSSRDQGVRYLLYKARTIKAIKGQQADKHKLLAKLQGHKPKMAPEKIMTSTSENTPLVNIKSVKSPQGSFGSYQLSPIGDN